MDGAEVYAYTKLGLAYNLSDYTTIFTENNVLIATNSTQFAQHLATVASNTSYDAIYLDPVGNPFTWPNNALDLISRPIDRPMVIRTKPGSGSKAVIGTASAKEDRFVPGAVALVDLEFNEINFSAGGNNILIEKCVGYFSMQGARSGNSPSTPMTNCQFRLSTAAYHSTNQQGTLTQGFFCYNVEGLLFEANVMHHNGWSAAMTRATPASQGGPDQLDHNIYANRPGHDYVFRFNVSSAASSHGLHAKAGGIAHDNLFLNCPISMQMGYGGDGQFASFGLTSNSNYYNNIAIGSDDINTTDNFPRGQFMYVTCAVSSFASGNLAIDEQTSAVNDNFFVWEHGFEIGITIANNKAINWTTTANFHRHGSGSAPSSITDLGGNGLATGLTPAAQTLCDTLRGAAYINALVNAEEGADIYQLKADLVAIRAGVIP